MSSESSRLSLESLSTDTYLGVRPGSQRPASTFSFGLGLVHRLADQGDQIQSGYSFRDVELLFSHGARHLPLLSAELRILADYSCPNTQLVSFHSASGLFSDNNSYHALKHYVLRAWTTWTLLWRWNAILQTKPEGNN